MSNAFPYLVNCAVIAREGCDSEVRVHSRITVSVLPSLMAMVNPGSILHTHTGILDYQGFFLLETIIRMCSTLSSPISCHQDGENTLDNSNSYSSLNATPPVVVPLDFDLQRNTYQDKSFVQHFSLHITVILSEDRIT